MKNEQKEEAKNLYFEANLSKTEIAEKLGINRKTLLFWSKQGNWDKLKLSAQNVPSLVAEKCYYLIDQFTSGLLEKGAVISNLSLKHAQTIHLLAATIKKLKNRSTVNESMEMFNFFLEGLNRRDPALAEQVKPQIEEYITIRNNAEIADFLLEGFNENGTCSEYEKTKQEKLQDTKDHLVLMDEFELFLESRTANGTMAKPDNNYAETQQAPYGHTQERSAA